MSTVVGIDGDVIAYSVAFVTDDEPIEYCLATVKRMINNIVKSTGADSFVIFLTGEGNFRDKIATLQGYKANREGIEKPKYHPDIRNYLIEHKQGIIIQGKEADDALGKWLSDPTTDENRILASIDKDLDMIGGLHFNWKRDELYSISKEEADKFFGIQMLTGDATDNIPGLYKMTGKRATQKVKQVIEDAYDLGGIHQMASAVLEAYIIASNDNPECRITKENLDCLKVVKEISMLLWIERANETNPFLEIEEKDDGNI